MVLLSAKTTAADLLAETTATPAETRTTVVDLPCTQLLCAVETATTTGGHPRDATMTVASTTDALLPETTTAGMTVTTVGTPTTETILTEDATKRGRPWHPPNSLIDTHLSPFFIHYALLER